MKVIMISTDRGLLKENSHVRQRLTHYGKIFDELHIVIFSNKKVLDFKLADNIYCYSTNSINKLFYIPDAIKISRRIINKIGKKDVVISSQDPFETGLVAVISKYLLKIKFQCQVHIDFFSPYYAKESIQSFIQVLIGPFILRRSDSVRVVSSKIEDYLVSKVKIPKDRIYVLPVFTDVQKIINSDIKINLKDKYKNFSNVLLMASRLVKQKGILVGIDAFKIVLENNPNSCLVIVGSGPEEKKIKKYVQDLELDKNIFFEAWTEDLVSYMKSCDIFLLPSMYEGWGLTVVEAAACSTPVVMTNVGCAEEFLFDGKNGIIVPVGDSKSFAGGVNKMLGDDNFRMSIKTNALRTANNMPNIGAYLIYYKEAMNIGLN